MSKLAQAYLFVVVLTAVLFVGMLPTAGLLALTEVQAWGVFGFIAIAVTAEALAIDFGTKRQARSSLAFLPFLACGIVFQPVVAVAAVTGVLVVSNFVFRRQGFLKGAFNIAQVALAVGIGSILYHTTRVPDGISWLGFAGLSIAFFAVNIGLTTVALAFIREQPVTLVLSQVAGPRGANFVYDILASPIAVVGSVLYRDHGVAGLCMIVLPLLLIRYSYLSKQKLEEANRDLLKVLVKAIETRDPYTSGHSLRVAMLSRMIAADLDLPRRQIDQIETAALLHDIGKIDAIFSGLLRKPYDLNSDERTLIQTHATKGAELLENLSSVSAEVIRAVRHHHERYDGTGYPGKLRGDEIPVAARIIMLSDSIDAMLSDRPYRRALSIGKVHSELARCSWSQFDPDIVRVILSRSTVDRAAGLVDRPTDISAGVRDLVASTA